MKTDQEIVSLLKETGHIDRPFGQQCDVGNFSCNHSLTHGVVQRALASYQDFLISNLEPLCLCEHGRSAQCDGIIGPATRKLFELPRCGCHDYGESVQAAMGTGSWKACHNIGDFHAATVKVHKKGMPSFLESVFERIWDSAAASYEAIGLRFIRVDSAEDANIEFSFVSRSSGWIGLAVVGNHETCDSTFLWCRYLAKYEPSDIIGSWTELVMHELGHNAGLQHTRGGIMNPSIITGLKPTWKGDPSESILNRYYGGEPVDGIIPPPTPPEAGVMRWQDGTEYDVWLRKT